MGRRGVIAAAFALAACGCNLGEDDPVDPGTVTFDAGVPYADIVTGFTQGGVAETCTDRVPVCGDVLDCGPSQVLGPPDGVTLTLEAGDVVEVGLLCGAIVERGSADGTPSSDFTVWSTVPAGQTAVVEVSYDASSWTTLNNLQTSDQSFDLSREELEVVRFVRITAQAGTSGIAIDAVEALQ